MAKIFFVGATGHVGGAVLDLISSTIPELKVKALVRDQQKSDRLTAQYPQIISIIGDLDNLDILESESRAADIVINTGPDVSHNAGIRSILKGLSGRSEKGYYIHTSGAALIWDKPDGSKPGTKIWDDVVDIKTLTSMPEESTHMVEDKAVFEASPHVNVAIVSPAFVYGLGPSPIHPFPLTSGVMLKAIRKLSSGFTISSGKNLQAFIHVMDLARLYLRLLSDALKPQGNTGTTPGREIWGPEAYYFAEQEELPFKEFMEHLVSALQKHGELKSSAIKEIDFDTIAEAGSWGMQIAVMFGSSTRVRSSRARSLGWKPQESGVGETIDEVWGKYLEAEKLG